MKTKHEKLLLQIIALINNRQRVRVPQLLRSIHDLLDSGADPSWKDNLTGDSAMRSILHTRLSGWDDGGEPEDSFMCISLMQYKDLVLKILQCCKNKRACDEEWKEFWAGDCTIVENEFIMQCKRYYIADIAIGIYHRMTLSNQIRVMELYLSGGSEHSAMITWGCDRVPSKMRVFLISHALKTWSAGSISRDVILKLRRIKDAYKRDLLSKLYEFKSRKHDVRESSLHLGDIVTDCIVDFSFGNLSSESFLLLEEVLRTFDERKEDPSIAKEATIFDYIAVKSKSRKKKKTKKKKKRHKNIENAI